MTFDRLHPIERMQRRMDTVMPVAVPGMWSWSPFQPKDLYSYDAPPAPAAFIDYDADNLAFADAADITEWPDAGPNGWDLPSTAAVHAVMDVDGLNGHPCAVFPASGTKPVLELTPIPEADLTKGDFTAVLAGSFSTNDTGIQLAADTNNDVWIELLADDSEFSVYSKQTSPFAEGYADDTPGATGTHVIVGVRDSTGLTLYVDGVQANTDAGAIGDCLFGRIHILMGYSTKLAVFRVYDSARDAVALSTPLMTKYGI